MPWNDVCNNMMILNLEIHLPLLEDLEARALRFSLLQSENGLCILGPPVK
jgi:hypothetical protein